MLRIAGQTAGPIGLKKIVVDTHGLQAKKIDFFLHQKKNFLRPTPAHQLVIYTYNKIYQKVESIYLKSCSIYRNIIFNNYQSPNSIEEALPSQMRTYPSYPHLQSCTQHYIMYKMQSTVRCVHISVILICNPVKYIILCTVRCVPVIKSSLNL